MTSDPVTRLGPILHFRGMAEDGVRLAAIVVRPDGEVPGALLAQDRVLPERLAALPGVTVWRYDFVAKDGYELDGARYEVVSDLGGDLRIGFVSCNGMETGDMERSEAERNRMWARLAEDHRDRPLGLLLQGGDQIYADEVTLGHPLSEDWPKHVPAAPSEADLDTLQKHLRHRFTQRYMAVMGGTAPAHLLARVPSLAMWDDHDICDGWGSLPQDRTDSAVGQMIYEVARETCLIFQHGAVAADLPQLCLEPSGASLGWMHRLPGVTLVAPDLRSERGLHNVMRDPGWAGVETVEPQPGDHTFVVSTVPLLGPRLSMVESLLVRLPGMQKYEDDLRDQWQSHAHRDEWQRMLGKVLDWRAQGPVTVLSGEIHLATRGEMGSGDDLIHQLVASGITHPAPPAAYAMGLGLLAGLGAAPLPDHPMRLRPLPGQSRVYTAERNYLVLDRCDGHWTAVWHLEKSGATPSLPLD